MGGDVWILTTASWAFRQNDTDLGQAICNDFFNLVVTEILETIACGLFFSYYCLAIVDTKGNINGF
jgi:hypothetical protein